jgi:hypothetical protein
VVHGIFRARIPYLGYVLVLPKQISQKVLTGAWFGDSDTILGQFGSTTGWAKATPTSTISPTPAPSATVTPRKPCVLHGNLIVTPFDEHGKVGIYIKLCLNNAGLSRINGLRGINVIQASTQGKDFANYISEDLDMSAKPFLDPGEGYCYEARIAFDPIMDGTYRDDIKITVLDTLNSKANNLDIVDPTSEPVVLELSSDFSLPATPTPTSTLTPTTTETLTPSPTLTLTQDPTLTPYPSETVEPTSTPIVTVLPTSTQLPTPMDTPTEEAAPTDAPEPLQPTTAPTLADLPTQTLTPLPTQTPVPSETPVPTPSDAPTAVPEDSTPTP